MGLAESAPATPATTPTGESRGTIGLVKRHFSRGGGSGGGGAELMRSPSAPAHVSLATLGSKSGAGNAASSGKRQKDLVRVPEVLAATRENSGRVAELADGSWAFFKGRRESLNTPTEQDCHYTCHPQCRDLVTLDCRGVQDDSDGNLSLSELAPSSLEAAPLSSQSSQNDQISDVKSLKDAASNNLELEDLKLLIDEHNAALPYPGLEMTMEEDGGNFRGFIRVHMNLCRPISVVAGTRPPSIYDILKEDQTIEKTLTSFYLPRDTVKALHITSTTTTSEVIVALLKKFKVVDNPHKFALYERYYEDGETAKVKMRRIADNETPLVLALRWSRESNCNKMFVLQENDTGDILWDAFTLPELNNFLRILDREEEEYKRIVRLKYQQLAAKIQEAMDRFSPPASTSAASSEVCAGMTENDQESSSLEVGDVAAEATEEQNAS